MDLRVLRFLIFKSLVNDEIKSIIMSNNGNQIRELFSRSHDTVFPKLGVFLGGYG